MNLLSKGALTVALASLVLLVTASVAVADDVPSFRKDKNKDTKEFAAKVFDALIKGTRVSPQNVALTKYEYTIPKGKEGRRDLNLVGTYEGKVTKKKFTAKVRLSIDTSSDKEWEVLKIDYSDDNKVTGKPKQKNIDEMVRKFNK